MTPSPLTLLEDDLGAPHLCLPSGHQMVPESRTLTGRASLQQAHLAHYFSQHVLVVISSFDSAHSLSVYGKVSKKSANISTSWDH